MARILMKSPYGTLYGILMEILWNPYGILMESIIWNPYEIPIESLWNHRMEPFMDS